MMERRRLRSQRSSRKSARLENCLEELDERARNAIRAAFLEGATYPELAAEGNGAARHDEKLDPPRTAAAPRVPGTMNDDSNLPEDANELAAEYALGVLTGGDLHWARKMVQTDGRFRDEVARWSGDWPRCSTNRTGGASCDRVARDRATAGRRA